ncbi:MAG: hypothetical protein PHT40_00420 [Patescibacteria group bacterium]|nr:hypothetical protein [Patescibacteria group bacterium]
MDQIDYNKWYYKIIYFFIVNQVALKRALIVVLIVVNMIFWGWSVPKWTDYFLTSQQHNASLAQLNNINYNALKGCNSLTSANVSLVKALVSSDTSDQYNFLAKITNPNAKCLVKKIRYYFTYQGHQQINNIYHEDFILPGETKYLFSFNEEIDMPVISAVELKIESEELQPLRDLKNLSLLKDLSYEKARLENLDESTIVTFNAVNDTPYDLWQVGYQVVLYADSNKTTPLAMGYTTVTNFLADSKEPAAVTWFKDFISPSLVVEIIPDLNVFAANIFMERVYEPGIPQGLETE